MTSTRQTRSTGATALPAYLEGWRRVLRAPWVALGVLAATFLAALPLGLAAHLSIPEQLRASRQADQVLRGWNAMRAGEFAHYAQGIARSFAYHVIGFGGTLDTLGRWLDNQSLNPAVAGAAAVYVGLWVVLSGGLLDRFARGRPVRAAAFFGACGRYAVRFARLALIVGPVYWALFHWLHPYLMVDLYERWSRGVGDPRTAVWLRAGLYSVFLLALVLVGTVVDFAEVRTVVEDRRSMIAALVASVRFIRRRVLKVAGLVLLDGLAWLLILRVWFQAAPSASTSTGAAILITQVYLLGRLWARLAFMASEIVLFQAELGRPGYVAAPGPRWPGQGP